MSLVLVGFQRVFWITRPRSSLLNYIFGEACVRIRSKPLLFGCGGISDPRHLHRWHVHTSALPAARWFDMLGRTPMSRLPVVLRNLLWHWSSFPAANDFENRRHAQRQHASGIG